MDLSLLKDRVDETDDINSIGEAINAIGHPYSRSLLHLAVLHHNVQYVEHLLKSLYIDINLRNCFDVTPLLAAVAFNTSSNRVISRILIERGADINAVNRDQDSPLHLAVDNSDVEMVAMLVYYAADVSVVNKYGMTPFMTSLLFNSDIEIQKLLLAHETDFNRVDAYGRSTLELAMKGNSPLIADVVQNGATTRIVSELLAFLCDADVSKSVCLQVMRTFFSSDAIGDIIEQHEDWDLLRNLIHLFAKRELPESELFPLVCICLSWGAELCLFNAEQVYHYYGYNETLKLFLHIGIEIENERQYPTFPYLLFNLQDDPLGLLNDNCDVRFFQNESKAVQLLNYFTPSCSKFVESVEEQIDPIHSHHLLSCKYLKILEGLSEPSLAELSRYATRKAICSDYGLTNSSQFYTLVKHLPIPELIKEILTYELPLYNRV